MPAASGTVDDGDWIAVWFDADGKARAWAIASSQGSARSQALLRKNQYQAAHPSSPLLTTQEKQITL